MPGKRLVVRVWDWFSQTLSPRFTMDMDDWLSVVRTVVMAMITAGLTEVASQLGKQGVNINPDRVLIYVAIAMVLQILRKWLGSY